MGLKVLIATEGEEKVIGQCQSNLQFQAFTLGTAGVDSIIHAIGGRGGQWGTGVKCEDRYILKRDAIQGAREAQATAQYRCLDAEFIVFNKVTLGGLEARMAIDFRLRQCANLRRQVWIVDCLTQ